MRVPDVYNGPSSIYFLQEQLAAGRGKGILTEECGGYLEHLNDVEL